MFCIFAKINSKLLRVATNNCLIHGVHVSLYFLLLGVVHHNSFVPMQLNEVLLGVKKIFVVLRKLIPFIFSRVCI